MESEVRYSSGVTAMTVGLPFFVWLKHAPHDFARERNISRCVIPNAGVTLAFPEVLLLTSDIPANNISP